jgi:hypothetical protein
VIKQLNTEETESNLVRYGNGYKAFVQHPRAAHLINQRLHTYPGSPNLEAEGSEGIFTFGQADYKFVAAVMRRFGLLN